ncbi:MAG: c-type cytochrome [Solirubrobacterales bacterium]
MMIRSALCAAALLSALSAALPAAAADLNNGRRLVEQGRGRATACSACHGADGSGLPRATGMLSPRLAGQSAGYMAKQLHDYAHGTRQHSVMSPIAKELSDKDIEDVTAYFAMVRGTPYPQPPKADSALLERGRQLAEVGSAEQNLQACNSCHGPEGAGLPPGFPRLAGQHAEYLLGQINAWVAGSRHNDPLGAMAAVARGLREDDNRAAAAYYASVRPPEQAEEEPLVAQTPP